MMKMRRNTKISTELSFSYFSSKSCSHLNILTKLHIHILRTVQGVADRRALYFTSVD